MNSLSELFDGAAQKLFDKFIAPVELILLLYNGLNAAIAPILISLKVNHKTLARNPR